MTTDAPLKITNVFTLDMIREAKQKLSELPRELPPEATIGDPSIPMTSFERDIRAHWHASGGRGNPPPLIVSQSEYDYFMSEEGFPAHCLKLVVKLPTSRPISQSKDWYRGIE